jgi:hypothetical protein
MAAIILTPQPLDAGHSWYVRALYPDGSEEHINGFQSESDAKEWIEGSLCKRWLRKRGCH